MVKEVGETRGRKREKKGGGGWRRPGKKNCGRKGLAIEERVWWVRECFINWGKEVLMRVQ